MSFSKLKIKYQISITIILVTLSVLTTNIIIGEIRNTKTINMLSDLLVEQGKNVVAYFINEQKETALQLALRYANDNKIKEYLASRNIKFLDNYISPIYKTLNQTNGITIFEFGDSNGIVIRRAHNPDRFGDDKSHDQAIRSVLNKKKLVGFIFGNSGLAIRSIVPIKKGNNVIGTFQIGYNLNQNLLFKLSKLVGNIAFFENDLLIQSTFSEDTNKVRIHKETKIYNQFISGVKSIIVNSKGIHSLYLPLYNPVNNDIQGMFRVDYNKVFIEQRQKDSIIFYIFLFLISTVFTFIIAVSVSRGIIIPIVRIVATLVDISKGDFTKRLNIKGNNELGQLAISVNKIVAALNKTKEKLLTIADGDISQEIDAGDNDLGVLAEPLNRIVISFNALLSEVHNAVVQVTSGANQISSTSQDLSGGASEQASSIEEISATIEEINSQAKLNAENTRQSAVIAKSSLEIAAKGNDKMKSLLEAMLRIDESASRIKKIVKFIDDIAFQINLLALNANVEAARAGKYGKGFAVVADEVRNLAVKSAGSVKETESMVEETIKNIATIQGLVDDSAAIFAEISNGAGKAAELLEEVSLATNEQANGLDEISKSIIQIDGVTQSNTASAEETAASSEQLASQAEQLKILIERFKLKKSRALPIPTNTHVSGLKDEKKVTTNKPSSDKKTPPLPSSVITLDDDHEIF